MTYVLISTVIFTDPSLDSFDRPPAVVKLIPLRQHMANIQFACISKLAHMAGGERLTLGKQQVPAFIDAPPPKYANLLNAFLWNILPLN